jgi:hypothetical protein
MPNAPRLPYVAKAPGGAEIVEFPLTTFEVGAYRLPIAGGGYFRLFPYAVTERCLSALNRRGEPVIFYLHPWEVDPEQPRVQASWFSRFRHYNNLSKCQSRLERLAQALPWTTVSNVLADRGFPVGTATHSIEAAQ